jgi:hypothetical protein
MPELFAKALTTLNFHQEDNIEEAFKQYIKTNN